jgi:integrase
MENTSSAGSYRRFNESEIESLLVDCHKYIPQTLLAKAKDVRDACAILLAIVHNLRPCQIVALDLRNFERGMGEHGALVFYDSNSDLQIIVDLTPKTRAALDHWLTLRGLLNPQTQALFIGLHHGWRAEARPFGERLTTRGLRASFDYRQRALNMKCERRSLDSLRQQRAKKLRRKN